MSSDQGSFWCTIKIPWNVFFGMCLSVSHIEVLFFKHLSYPQLPLPIVISLFFIILCIPKDKIGVFQADQPKL